MRHRPSKQSLEKMISNAMSIIMDEYDGGDSRTEINSHANIVIFGKHATILAVTGNNVGVIPFIPDYQTLDKVSIVDVVVQYICQYMSKVYILVFRDALSVPSMYNNLNPPFLMRESVMGVKDTAKIHAMDPSVEDHSIYFTNFNIPIVLFLHGVLSYLQMSKT